MANDLQGLYNYAVEGARNAALAPIDQQEISDIAAANERQSAVLNTGALAQTRRRAGGTTFRRRGTGVSANQLVSGLGVANAKALAAKRRELALKNVGVGISFGTPFQI